jgi:hypothetical protein
MWRLTEPPVATTSRPPHCEPIAPVGNRSPGGDIKAAATLAPHDKPDLVCGSDTKRHRRARVPHSVILNIPNHSTTVIPCRSLSTPDFRYRRTAQSHRPSCRSFLPQNNRQVVLRHVPMRCCHVLYPGLFRWLRQPWCVQVVAILGHFWKEHSGHRHQQDLSYIRLNCAALSRPSKNNIPTPRHFQICPFATRRKYRMPRPDQVYGVDEAQPRE